MVRKPRLLTKVQSSLKTATPMVPAAYTPASSKMVESFISRTCSPIKTSPKTYKKTQYYWVSVYRVR